MKRKLLDNWKRVQHRIEDACARVQRKPSEVTLVAVTKYASLDIIRVLVDMGVQHIGENRVQELTKRAGMVNEWLGRRARDRAAGARPRPHWHMIGHLQRNKVKTVLPWVDLIHSVDSLRLAEEIDAQSARLERVTPILMQVNASGEGTKSGVAVAATTHLAEQLHTLPHIQLRGLMTIAPLTDDASVIRHTFERTRELFDEIVGERIGGPAFKELSFGMSHDFEIGIEFGATYVRIGSALYEGVELAPQTAQAD
jgi:pyridoxal phosphate enzyme (YggS family)